MDNRQALNPRQSVVVEACAGSGKTWLLVSRVVRLLLEGVPSGEILAITFTRKAAQEMQARLRDWLYDLASKDDDFVRQFLRERAVEEADIERLLPRARGLYQQFLLTKPTLTISTFHGWFMQILQRAPLDAVASVQLIEKTAELWEEAWQTLLDELHAQPGSETAQSMMALFAELGLSNTQTLLRHFVDKRSEWWAYTQGEEGLDFALAELRAEWAVDLAVDPLAELLARPHFAADVRHFAGLYSASKAQLACAERLLLPLDGTLPVAQAFARLWAELFTQKNEPRVFKANKGQDEAPLLQALAVVRSQVLAAHHTRQTQQIYRFHQHGLRCGVALLEAYQQLKQRQQVLDFGDLEWRVCQLLNNSDHAEYLQYKLDSRYRHVLLDEFQDTNPLQWQILQSWFAASKAVDSKPCVFVVGDPKQSIYRFRRADARLFDVVRNYLQRDYGAVHLKHNTTRRNSPRVLAAVNGVFAERADYAGFERHHAHQQDLPGYVEVLPLELMPARAEAEAGELVLRNPLQEALPASEEGARAREAQCFAEKLLTIVGSWQVQDEGQTRPAEFADIMVLVRRRTHLQVYEQALRRCAIPFLTSRRGGLLDTLEAADLQALLTFLMTPFADLALAHTLRTPVFGCSDQDLMQIQQSVGTTESGALSWWLRLKLKVESGTASGALLRAQGLLSRWMNLADKLPVHDLLDRIYFEGELKARYAAAMPEVMRAAVDANLQAFLEIALNLDSGRYPSLPGFLRELAGLRRADDEAPDEGKPVHAGNAVRIYTVHEAKGLEAPIVWMLDCNARPPAERGCDVLVDWPTEAAAPTHFSLYADQKSRGAMRAAYFATEQALAEREDLNLLYVAMTRAKQALLVSGSGKLLPGMWYQRICDALPEERKNPLAAPSSRCAAPSVSSVAARDERLCRPMPTGQRKEAKSEAERQGIWLHGLLEAMTESIYVSDLYDIFMNRHAVPAERMSELWHQAEALLQAPELARFFDARQYLAAANELAYVNGSGQLRRIDRLVEFAEEVWVLDYKTGTHHPAQVAQLQEYRSAMQSVHPHKAVRCALIFADGKLLEI